MKAGGRLSSSSSANGGGAWGAARRSVGGPRESEIDALPTLPDDDGFSSGIVGKGKFRDLNTAVLLMYGGSKNLIEAAAREEKEKERRPSRWASGRRDAPLLGGDAAAAAEPPASPLHPWEKPGGGEGAEGLVRRLSRRTSKPHAVSSGQRRAIPLLQAGDSAASAEGAARAEQAAAGGSSGEQSGEAARKSEVRLPGVPDNDAVTPDPAAAAPGDGGIWGVGEQSVTPADGRRPQSDARLPGTAAASGSGGSASALQAQQPVGAADAAEAPASGASPTDTAVGAEPAGPGPVCEGFEGGAAPEAVRWLSASSAPMAVAPVVARPAPADLTDSDSCEDFPEAHAGGGSPDPRLRAQQERPSRPPSASSGQAVSESFETPRELLSPAAPGGANGPAAAREEPDVNPAAEESSRGGAALGDSIRARRSVTFLSPAAPEAEDISSADPPERRASGVTSMAALVKSAARAAAGARPVDPERERRDLMGSTALVFALIALRNALPPEELNEEISKSARFFEGCHDYCGRNFRELHAMFCALLFPDNMPSGARTR